MHNGVTVLELVSNEFLKGVLSKERMHTALINSGLFQATMVINSLLCTRA